MANTPLRYALGFAGSRIFNENGANDGTQSNIIEGGIPSFKKYTLSREYVVPRVIPSDYSTYQQPYFFYGFCDSTKYDGVVRAFSTENIDIEMGKHYIIAWYGYGQLRGFYDLFRDYQTTDNKRNGDVYEAKFTGTIASNTFLTTFSDSLKWSKIRKGLSQIGDSVTVTNVAGLREYYVASHCEITFSTNDDTIITQKVHEFNSEGWPNNYEMEVDYNLDVYSVEIFYRNGISKNSGVKNIPLQTGIVLVDGIELDISISEDYKVVTLSQISGSVQDFTITVNWVI